MKKKILIVGGTGFLGYHLCKNFLKLKYDVSSLSKSKPKKIRKLSNVKYFYGNIAKEKNIKFLENKNFNFVINCGGYVDHVNIKKTLTSHFYGCKNLYEVFSKKKIETFIQIGSSTEYGKNNSPQKESLKGKPSGIYGRSKLKATNFLFSTLRKKEFPFVVLRFYQIYGPYQDNNRFISFVINSCMNDKKFPCSEGKQYRDFLYIDDAVNAVEKSLGNKQAYGKIINVGYGKPIQLKEIIKIIKHKIKRGTPKFGEISLRINEPKTVYPNLHRSKKYLKWIPKISFKKGILKTINFYKNNNLV
jgi:dTDP-glucose 4,6-dehydratase